MRVLIIGAGPAGIAAAYRLNELGETDWHLYEATGAAGGRARATRSKGFTYDMGQRIDTRNPYVDRMLRATLGDDIAATPVRDAMVIDGQTVPMPLQNNIRLLDSALLVDCIIGLARLPMRPSGPQNLQAWLRASFGEALSRRVLEPYLRKYWAHPLDLMDAAWAPAQMPGIELELLLRAIIDDTPRPPEASAPARIYPNGGTAEPMEQIAVTLSRNISFDSSVTAIDPRRRALRLASGLEDRYDVLLTTMPLSDLLPITAGVPTRVRSAAMQLASSSARMLGIGFDSTFDVPAERIHFPDPAVPFSRVTYLSAMSRGTTPGSSFSSIIIEASASHWDAPRAAGGAAAAIDALIRCNLLPPDAGTRVVDATPFEIPCARPTPTIERDVALEVIQPFLMSEQIYSRGLTGSWMHEAGDLDRSMMQGVEAIDRIVLGTPERTWPVPALRPMEARR